MPSRHFHLVTQWSIAAPVDMVWNELSAPQRWPQWWRAVRAVEQLEAGDADGLGAYWRMRWRTALPYSLSFNMRTVRVERHRLIEGRASGELQGVGRWRLSPFDGDTLVRYDWRVDVSQPWMRLVLPVARPIFTWNHHVVMEWGRRGLGAMIKQQQIDGDRQASTA